MDLKQILQHNYKNNNVHLLIKVPPSRFRLIITSYRSLCGLDVDEITEARIKGCNDFTLFKIKGKTNTYKIVKTNEEEIKSKCPTCTCGRTRWINPKTGDCYFHEMIKTNYTTKLTND